MIEKRNSLLFSEGVRRHGFSKVDVSDQLIKLRMERFLKGAADGRGGRKLRMQRKSSGKYFKFTKKIITFQNPNLVNPFHLQQVNSNIYKHNFSTEINIWFNTW